LTSEYNSNKELHAIIKAEADKIAELVKSKKGGKDLKKGSKVVVVGSTDTGAAEYHPIGHVTHVKAFHSSNPWLMTTDKTQNGYQQWYHKNDFALVGDPTPAFELQPASCLYVGFGDVGYANGILNALQGWVCNVLYEDESTGEMETLEHVTIEDVGYSYI